MGTGEEITSKPVTSEMPATPSYHDWASTMQVSAYNHAYYGPGATPPPFFPPAVASPTPHPYLWGSKHPLISPYGTPVPYAAIYPSGVYAHPDMHTAPSTAHVNPDLEGKVPGAKDQGPAKKAKETPGTTGWKPADTGNAGSALGNDVISQSSGNVSEGSSDASGEDTSNQQGDRCWQDERELKQQKRKQSNRESARRSRLRRQAECEELQKRVETLGDENRTLREELQRLSEECEKLESQNSSVKEELEHLCGSNAVANLE